MSPEQMHYPYPQPRPFRMPCRAPNPANQAHQSPYSTSGFPYTTLPGITRQPAIESGFRFPFSMPNFSSLTNSALVDALLTPTANEHEQEHQTKSFHDNSVLQRKRSHPFVATSSEEVDQSQLYHQVADQQDVQQDISQKRPRKQQKRRSAAQSEFDDDYYDEPHPNGFGSPQPVRKPRRSTRPKKSPNLVKSLTFEEDDTWSPQKGEQSERSTPARKAPRKARVGRLVRKKPIGIAVPKTLSEAGPADRMMWEWKNKGKNWEEIRAEWKRITGMEPGGSSLSVRYIKLVENLARNGAAGDIELLRFKKEAEEELMTQLWYKVAEKMVEYSPESEHNPKDLQKRYNMIVRSGYDVEQLIAEDNIKRENEKQDSPTTLHDYEQGVASTTPLANITMYDDPVANETAAYLREQGTMTKHNVDRLPLHESQFQPILDDAANLFGSISALNPETEGLVQRRYAGDVKFTTPDNRNMENFMPGAALLSTSPAQAQKDQNDSTAAESCQSQAGILVNYNSDSE